MLATKMEQKLTRLIHQLDHRYMTLHQAKLIYDRMLKMEAEGQPPKRILEIGTFAGTGAILLSAMVEEWHGHVTTVDLPWSGKPNKHFQITSDMRAAQIGVTNLSIIRREDGAQGWMREHLAVRGFALDMIYLDGGHTWDNTVLQVMLSLACLRPGGWLVMDDLNNPPWPDVQEVWETVVCRVIPEERRYCEGLTGFAQVS